MSEIENVFEAKVNIKKQRIWEIDFLRGFCLCLMFFDHMMYDFAYLFPDIWDVVPNICITAQRYWVWGLREVVQTIVAGIFVFLSGISSHLTKSNFRRGIKLGIFAIALTLGTYLFELVFAFSGALIVFGILHMLAVCMLIFSGIEFLCKKLRKEEKTKYLDLIVYAVLGVVAIIVGAIYMGKPLSGGGFSAPLVYSYGFYSADYFPMLPWLGVFFFGYIFGRLFYAKKEGRWREPQFTRPVTFIGRNTVWFYLAHQVVIFAVIYLLGLILGY